MITACSYLIPVNVFRLLSMVSILMHVGIKSSPKSDANFSTKISYINFEVGIFHAKFLFFSEVYVSPQFPFHNFNPGKHCALYLERIEKVLSRCQHQFDASVIIQHSHFVCNFFWLSVPVINH